MGMYAVLTVISDRNIQRVRKNPPLIWRYIAPDDPGAYLDAVRRPLLIRTLGRLLGRSKGSSLPDQELVDGESFTEDLDKAWHGIHYLLTGTAWEGSHHSTSSFAVASSSQRFRLATAHPGSSRPTKPPRYTPHSHL